jgi:hypothetical protein
VPGYGAASETWIVSGSISPAKRMVSAMVSRVSPGSPRMKVPWIVMPSAFASFVKRRAASMRTPFFTLFRIAWLPDS